jgi:hypothetical protein
MKKPVSKFAFQMQPAALHRGLLAGVANPATAITTAGETLVLCDDAAHANGGALQVESS